MSVLTGRFEQRALHTGVVFPFKATVLEYMVNLVNDPCTSVARMAAIIGWNPILARSVALKANSSYGLPGRVRDVNLALALLGSHAIQETVNRAVASGATRHMVNSFEYCQTLWDHSLTCALVAKAAATELGGADPGLAFVAGLVHDVGFLFLGDDLPSPEADHITNWEPMADCIRIPPVYPTALHEEAGSWMVDRWETLSPEIHDAVRHHHEPGNARQDPRLAAVVHVADVICHRLFGGPLGKDPDVPFDPEALAMLGMRDESSPVTPMSTAWLQQSVIHRAPALALKVKVLMDTLVLAYEELQERERCVLAMHYCEGISIKGIAGVLKTSTEDVVGLHDQAMRQMQRILVEIGEVS